MSEADKLFSNLLYKKIRDNENEIVYRYKEYLTDEWITHDIVFSKLSKLFIKYQEDYDGIFHACGFDMQELKAINAKVKELRME